MALFRSERGIGRGEVPESRLEVPFFALFMLVCGSVLFIQHLYLQNTSLTLALSVSMLVFGATVLRVDFGVYILVMVMLLSPEIDAGNALSGERSLNLRYDDILIVVIFFGVMVRLAFEGRLHLWEPSPVNYGIVAYYSICIISTLLAWERNLGAWDKRTAFFVMLKMLEFYMVFFLVGHALRNGRDIRRQLVLFFTVAIIVSAYGIYSIGTTPRVSAPFEKGGTEPNTLGGYLVIVMCVATGMWTQCRSRGYQAVLLGIVALAFVPFLHTLSRASYLALLVGFVVLGLVSRRFVLLAAIGGCLLASPLVMPDTVKERVGYTLQEDDGQEIGDTGIKVDKSTHERFLVWRKVPYILSIGPAFMAFGGGVSWESVLDSQYARVILETGIVGLAAFLFLQFSLLRTMRQAYRWSEDWVGRGLAMGMFATTLALVVHSAGTISFLIVRIMEPYWLLAAMAVIVRREALLTHWERQAITAETVEAARVPADAAVQPVEGTFDLSLAPSRDR